MKIVLNNISVDGAPAATDLCALPHGPAGPGIAALSSASLVEETVHFGHLHPGGRFAEVERWPGRGSPLELAADGDPAEISLAGGPCGVFVASLAFRQGRSWLAVGRTDYRGNYRPMNEFPARSARLASAGSEARVG